ncbi:isopentenyl-diphosphate delta-isomerase, FMN-dependent [Geofilum rubicundum JCM 15548]|uniref:Isopentenyl-diphosphate delta-isomerase, FMN-dependent n=2 Tax=Geofilum TaxID=1236988 RepID=A0A0E9M2J9_9BACT|nr:isopentenyl-diphosphate delta-isomerase, FMN-dependent [Geofilum rubicundum JCM 15548]
MAISFMSLLSPHPSHKPQPFSFLGKSMRLPVWISSMTGGTALAGKINRNLAQACAEFGLGMGLGSCRILLEDDKYLPDFDVRPILGEDVPFFANLGIAQLERMIQAGSTDKIDEMVQRLQADGIIIHVNPLQEAFQPEGDLLAAAPIETIQAFLEQTQLKVIVKEVGQGMGPESLKALLKLPIEAIEFGALGGTNFTKLELARHTNTDTALFDTFGRVGHTAEEMAAMVNQIVGESPDQRCRQLIISGGITNVLDGYRLVKSSQIPAVFGMGSAFLKHATEDYPTLQTFVKQIEKSLLLADQFLRVR